MDRNMKNCKQKGDLVMVDPFRYRGKVVVGIYGYSICQYIKNYLPIWSYLLALLYVIGRDFICDCVYLTVATATPVIIVSIFVPLWTYFVRKDEVRKNHAYEDETREQ